MNNKLYILLLALLLPVMASAKAGDIEVRGVLDSITSNSVTINGKSYALTSGTEYEDSVGNTIQRKDLSVGMYVEAKLQEFNDMLIVRELEIEDERSGDDSDDSDDDDGKKDSKSSDISDKALSDLNSDERFRFRAKLVSGDSIFPRGWARRKARSRGDRIRDRFVAKLLIGTPDASPTNLSDTPALLMEIRARLYRQGEEYAVCELVYDRSRPNDRVGVLAEFKVDVRSRVRLYPNRDAKVRSKDRRGECDIDLSSSGTQAGIPPVQRGDEVIIYELTLDGEVPLVSGLFR